MGKRCCCQRLPCCCGNSPEEWTLNLGVGGWIDSRCGRCADVQGEFTVRHDVTSIGHEFSCLFTYLVNDWCTD